MSEARIGRVKMKAGGADVRVLARPRVAPGLGERLLRGARYCTDDDSKIIAYSIVALHEDGSTSASTNTLFGDVKSCMNAELFVGLVTDRTRWILSTEPGVCDVFNRGMRYDR